MNKKVLITILFLIGLIALTAYINRGTIKDKAVMIENAELSIKEAGNEGMKLDFTLIQLLGEETFVANLKSSGKDPVEHQYKGVPLKAILNSANVSFEEKKQVIVRSVDGYTVALTVEEVLDDDNVYIAYERNGEPLGTKEEGGSGPYQVIIRKDPFSQRWAKFVVEVELQ
ncbi:molybdopterin-dependent oxidoreductase [Alkaliphilus peptidifermentans]|uniref:Oxidoreductase molybdopterin binding domain-containing protein n=1 Tax=Alkaliphilus peptidifermentans DSM 18978 TaxID=1120976 RepID=A0A1G5GKT0_9FIRM|nr:molybdopterin-dependent oxidoreductase [Alkaliphilus peptidifermentans]SCY52133.1 Oxidoreductase molybdopterin binding domain-containing protein [Alkaliphilus peptidifermentans DSM 18978]